MRKTAVVYDKWLSALGGGEVVACTVAKVLEESGYSVTFISGKKTSPEKIREKLNIDLSKIEFKEVWNDEGEIKRLTKDKDLFINTSFLDYTKGSAKKNLYYVHFPTKSYKNIFGFIFNKYLVPQILKVYKPIEYLDGFENSDLKSYKSALRILNNSQAAIYFLEVDKEITIQFKIHFENFYSSLLKTFKWNFKGAQILDEKISVIHVKNEVSFEIKLKPHKPTIYIDLSYKPLNLHNLSEDKIYLTHARVLSSILPGIIYKKIAERLNRRFRAGVFFDIEKRLDTYKTIICHSEYVKSWIKKYWKIESVVLHPPVDQLSLTEKSTKKNNWICSVGRFFTLGHGKKQEVLIKAFKKLYLKGYKNWELHLAGGLGNEPTSQEFVKKLKAQAKGFPVYFHFNISKDEVENIYQKSKIYWHGAGFGEKISDPIKFEHFGIAPIEAISAGSIPILFKGGGLIEVIEISGLNPSEHLFSTEEELVDKTTKLIDSNVRIDWEIVQKRISDNFSIDAFKKKFLTLINES
jgi:hypothetical protein